MQTGNVMAATLTNDTHLILTYTRIKLAATLANTFFSQST